MKKEKIRFFDKPNKRLVYIHRKADNNYWDDHWESQNRNDLVSSPPKHRWLIHKTKKYLDPGSSVLEGGCGLGDKVRALSLSGYNAIGVDFADKTVKWVKENFDALDIRKGDVRELDFPDNYFDGYWSLGVIEHFYNGYHQIAEEMSRVIRKNGYLFLTFPSMNKARTKKSTNKQYKLWHDTSENLEEFYQFALNPDDVLDFFINKGFELVEIQGLGTLKGMDEERVIPPFILKVLKKSKMASKFNVIFDPLLGRTFGHMTMLILRKN